MMTNLSAVVSAFGPCGVGAARLSRRWRRRPFWFSGGSVPEGRPFALGGAVVTVEADVDAVERRLAAGELSCPSCSGVLAG